MILVLVIAALVLGAVALVYAMAWGYAAGEADIRSSIYRQQQERQRWTQAQERPSERKTDV